MIGERLADLRRDAGLTQDQLAAALNINKHSISAYEREKNEPSDDIKMQIAHYFGVSVDYLVGMTNDPRPHEPNNNILRLPRNFPPAALASLADYVEFLKERYRSP